MSAHRRTYRRRRRVEFRDDLCQYMYIESVDDYTPDDIMNLWYQEFEYARIDEENDMILEIMMINDENGELDDDDDDDENDDGRYDCFDYDDNNSSASNYCARGLEPLVPRRAADLLDRRELLWEYVITEQQAQWRENVEDPIQIAKAAKSIGYPTGKIARLRAKIDRRKADKIHSRSKKSKWSAAGNNEWNVKKKQRERDNYFKMLPPRSQSSMSRSMSSIGTSLSSTSRRRMVSPARARRRRRSRSPPRPTGPAPSIRAAEVMIPSSIRISSSSEGEHAPESSLTLESCISTSQRRRRAGRRTPSSSHPAAAAPPPRTVPRQKSPPPPSSGASTGSAGTSGTASSAQLVVGHVVGLVMGPKQVFVKETSSQAPTASTSSTTVSSATSRGGNGESQRTTRPSRVRDHLHNDRGIRDRHTNTRDRVARDQQQYADRGGREFFYQRVERTRDYNVSEREHAFPRPRRVRDHRQVSGNSRDHDRGRSRS